MRQILAGVVALSLVAGCGGKATSTSSGGNDHGAPDAGDDRDAVPIDGGTPPDMAARAMACARFVAVEYDACAGLPAAEMERRREAYQTDCLNWFAMPGSGVTAPTLEACAEALELTACERRTLIPLACDLRGTFGEGVPCFTYQQCASGVCEPDTPTPGRTCGHCTKPVASGDSCPHSECALGSVCSGAGELDARVCTPTTFGVAGDPCDQFANRCAVGLHCDANGRCEPPLADGDACSSSREPGCRSPSYCSAEGRCRPPAAEGEPCEGEGTCLAGLVCTTNPALCEPAVWRQGGQPCGDGASRCLTGPCVIEEDGPMGHCLPVVGAGAACDGFTALCDAGLVCFDGTCQGAHAIECQ